VTKRPPTDMGASAFNRLKALARAPGQDFNLTLIRYGCERLLYRLSQSPHADSFMLKGATLFAVWEEQPHRATRDVDLLGFGEDSAERLRAVFTDVCGQDVEDDGARFDPSSVTVSDIREGQTYQGKRILVDGKLGTAALRVQIDVGFGDALAAVYTETTLPTLLDFPAPRLRAYPAEAVVAEKLHAMAEHGMLNSRMKDIYDVQALAARLEFDGASLAEAVRLTFERRGRPIGADLPASLTGAFAGDPTMLTRWAAFLRRNRLEAIELATAVDDLRAFLLGPWEALKRGEEFERDWPRGGPWRDAADS
jgi:predicted nucleotidyltransferase component of viral defense system